MIVGIVLAGGSGTRFWPLSREKKPKQLLPLLSQRTLLEDTIDRLKPVVDQVAISTGKKLERQIKKVTNEKLIVEPSRRDTAGAIGLCATTFSEDDMLVFMPSDHYIAPRSEFHKTIKRAIRLAKDKIVVVGVEPTFPSTGFGYIQPGTGNKVLAFKEKPSKQTASKYLKNGYLWNAGMFIVRAGFLLEQFKEYAPDIYDDLLKIKKGASLQKVYSQIRKISFDYAIMERTASVSYVKASFEWNDIGSFDALGTLKGGKNTILEGELVDLNSAGNVVHSSKTVALIDCKDMVVIDTHDAILVCPKESVQKAKQIVGKLKDHLK